MKHLVILIALAGFFYYLGHALVDAAAPSFPEGWGASYEANPSATDAVSEGDDHMRTLKQEIRTRAETEIDFGTLATTGSTNDDGRLREGAARAFFQDAAPTAIAEADRDASTALDEGRLWFESDDSNQAHVYDGVAAAFETVEAIAKEHATSHAAGGDDLVLNLVTTLAFDHDNTTVNLGADETAYVKLVEVTIDFTGRTGATTDVFLLGMTTGAAAACTGVGANDLWITAFGLDSGGTRTAPTQWPAGSTEPFGEAAFSPIDASTGISNQIVNFGVLENLSAASHTFELWGRMDVDCAGDSSNAFNSSAIFVLDRGE